MTIIMAGSMQQRRQTWSWVSSWSFRLIHKHKAETVNWEWHMLLKETLLPVTYPLILFYTFHQLGTKYSNMSLWGPFSLKSPPGTTYHCLHYWRKCLFLVIINACRFSPPSFLSDRILEGAVLHTSCTNNCRCWGLNNASPCHAQKTVFIKLHPFN